MVLCWKRYGRASRGSPMAGGHPGATPRPDERRKEYVVDEPAAGDASPGLASVGDRRLVADCVAGAPGAWEMFVGHFGGLFHHVAQRTAAQRGRTLGIADRDDIVADILLACVRDDAAVLRAYAARASLPTYLTVIARRVTARWLTRQARAAPPVGAPRHVGASPAAASGVDREEIELLLGRLDERERLLVRLHHLEARSYGEISRLTGMPLGSIGPALSRAKAKMRLPAAG